MVSGSSRKSYTATLMQFVTAISEIWSNGPTEGQTNKLKTLKRSMYGRAGTELLRARMLPLRVWEARESRQTLHIREYPAPNVSVQTAEKHGVRAIRRSNDSVTQAWMEAGIAELPTPLKALLAAVGLLVRSAAALGVFMFMPVRSGRPIRRSVLASATHCRPCAAKSSIGWSDDRHPDAIIRHFDTKPIRPSVPNGDLYLCRLCMSYPITHAFLGSAINCLVESRISAIQVDRDSHDKCNVGTTASPKCHQPIGRCSQLHRLDRSKASE
jgi:hypothetical protein